MSASARPPRLSASTMALVLVAAVCTVLVAARATAERTTVNLLTDHGVVAGTDTAPSTAPTIAQLIGRAKVTAPGGRVTPLHTLGEPTILMISSRTCSWCKRALKDLGGMAGGRPLPRLTLLTLEGAEEGLPMLAQEQLTGARLRGPASDADRQRITARFPGTPTFVAIDRRGRVVRTLPGYPIPDELRHWYAVMVGEQDVP
ncbi:MAG: hypothetical protein P3B76_14105 [Gemmatimonadota bacterium]|nr:hypothetical protein [Gemmatimonadota bacterium]